MRQQLENVRDSGLNPIDSVEDILSAHNWTFDRPSRDELTLEVSGNNSKYNLFFIWQASMNALQFGCHYDIRIPEDNMKKTRTTLASINENLWMGHFDLPCETRIPIFRHTSLLHGSTADAAAESIENMVDIALIQCERYGTLFRLLATSAPHPDETTIALATMEALGHA